MGVSGVIDESASQPEPVTTAEQPGEGRVPEVTAGELMLERCSGHVPLLLDCREDIEWDELRIPDSVHIPMHQIPRRLAELDKHADIVVLCAHGNRSYHTAGYLLRQGFNARSLRGGLANWQAKGGQVERGRHP